MNVPEVAAKRELILSLGHDNFWEEVSINKLNLIRLYLRGLIKHLDKDERKIYYTNFGDAIVSDKPVEGYIKTNIETAYKIRLEMLLRKHKDDLAVDKIRKNESITDAELEHLKGILLKDIEEDKKESFSEFLGKHALDILIKKLLGLDEAAVRMAFAEFERKYALSDIQIRFLKEIVRSISVNGVVKLEDLLDAPQIKGIHHGGIDAVFPLHKANEMAEIIKKFQSDVA